ncbi:hypothetical protein M430DRAFT_17371 [Amorphotheca resinae ATCC 22711]|uniref:Uncharacterized protein n=1 Tax=Amorphotheca resinae ATCC 22711 TaxID=857342 RepID=A0A2T3B985_AMORE|nr:hypothetical protein M430DRAFT_17371 [Amorphotheca resinae ATCC 22711]PSS23449.1 hypothetical protein M430DRAFT_17371 [Amorphotheca resinae ATCC 22711]
MAFDSRLTLRSALVALLLSNLVVAEPIRLYNRQASEAPGADALTALEAIPTGVASGNADVPSPSGGSLLASPSPSSAASHKGAGKPASLKGTAASPNNGTQPGDDGDSDTPPSTPPGSSSTGGADASSSSPSQASGDSDSSPSLPASTPSNSGTPGPGLPNTGGSGGASGPFTSSGLQLCGSQYYTPSKRFPAMSD